MFMSKHSNSMQKSMRKQAKETARLVAEMKNIKQTQKKQEDLLKEVLLIVKHMSQGSDKGEDEDTRERTEKVEKNESPEKEENVNKKEDDDMTGQDYENDEEPRLKDDDTADIHVQEETEYIAAQTEDDILHIGDGGAKNEDAVLDKDVVETEHNEDVVCDMPTFNILSQSQEMDKTAESCWGVGSQDNSQFVKEICKTADEVAKKAFESYSSNPCTAIIVKPNQEQEDLPKQKRFARSPVKYTPSEHSPKRRKREKGKKRADNEFLPPLKEIVGPFTEDPTESPPDHEIERVRAYLQVGLLKNFQKNKNGRRYKVKEEKW
ncbi:unnamed protein product, partial [Cuscuta europaea]